MAPRQRSAGAMWVRFALGVGVLVRHEGEGGCVVVDPVVAAVVEQLAG